MPRIRKALVAGIGAALTALITAAVQHGGFPDAAAIGSAVALGVAAGWATWRVPNTPSQG